MLIKQWEVKISSELLYGYICIVYVDFLVPNMLYCRITVKMRTRVNYDSVFRAQMIIDIEINVI